MKLLTNLDRAEEEVADLNQLWTNTVMFLDDKLKPKATSSSTSTRCRG